MLDDGEAHPRPGSLTIVFSSYYLLFLFLSAQLPLQTKPRATQNREDSEQSLVLSVPAEPAKGARKDIVSAPACRRPAPDTNFPAASAAAYRSNASKQLVKLLLSPCLL